ncbi:hypothetical protein SAMN05192563_102488 [Paraburkholderia aspalathi]|uniref:Uncharacterized protein n=1 Tax=Paraburkholderia aspalathi TaxID=1324617 RepID=A0A1I7EJB1_9BURK|nr:hypothetical protein SAMN05192563_102488 [Paraburkholderia aspalathi]
MQTVSQMTDQAVFEVGFRVLVLQVQKLQHERIPNGLFRRRSVVSIGLPCLSQHRRLVVREGDALVELTADLPVKLPH